jgi:uncharacterized protein (TIGR00255 family)
MTGYGHGKVDSPLGSFDVTIKSLNHRFCSINTHLPELFEHLDLQIHDLVRSHVRRGRIEFRLDWEPSGGLGPLPYVNNNVVEAYLAGLSELEESFELHAQDRIALISGLPGVFTMGKGTCPDTEAVWKPISDASEMALRELVASREREGDAMKTAIAGMLGNVEKVSREIEEFMPGRIERARKRIQDRVSEVLQGKDVNDARVLLEVSLLADRWDISEELTRVKAHIDQLKKTIENVGAIGRRLLFLLQELQREVNTITSKAYDVEISHRAVGIKEILEQIREQVENIE